MSKFSKTNLALNNHLNKSNYTFGVDGLTHPQQFEVISTNPFYTETFQHKYCGYFTNTYIKYYQHY